MAFIPAFHFDKPEDKLTPEWCRKAVNYLFYANNNLSLLAGKNVKEIDGFTSGNFDMKEFKMMFKSMRKKLQGQPTGPDGQMASWTNDINTVGVRFEPLALIPIKMNSAVNNIYRIPVDVTCTAQDALAMKKKKEDIEFLKKKPEMEAELQDIADRMGIEKVDLGSTKHAAINYFDAPTGLDLEKPEHQELFAKFFYSLRVETAFEKALRQFHSLKDTDEVRKLSIIDQFKYGVSVVRDYASSITGLPDLDYIYPGDMYGPSSDLPDKSDQTHRYIDKDMTVMEMFHYFSDEICDKNTLDEMIRGKEFGYCACNHVSVVDTANFDTYKVNLKYFEVKSVDSVSVKSSSNGKPGKRGKTYFDATDTECKDKIWGQNTYCFYWLTGTRYFLGIKKLPGTHRTRGKEAFQNFSSHIYKSQEKSAVELSIVENKKAQIAEIKLEHTLIKSLPPGKFIDLKFIRGALDGLKEENKIWTIDDLLSLAYEHNQLIGDSTEFDSKIDGQLRPYMDIPGGLKGEANGYLTVILNASQNIASITGINEQLTGQSAEELVGLQQLRINSGLNAIDYCNQAIRHQWEGINNSWANLIMQAIEAGGKTKQAIIDMIGEADTELLNSLDEAPLHTLTIKTEVGGNAELEQWYMREMQILEQKGYLSAADKYMLSGIDNTKERFRALYFIEQRRKEEEQRIRTEQYANMQQIQQTKSQTDIAVQQQKGNQDLQSIDKQGQVDAQLMTLGNQLGLTKAQVDGMIKRALQKERGDQQLEKQIKAIQEKNNVEQQQAYGI